MRLSPGTRLGVYEITAQIGEGGMGQVFRARDTKLDRDVAIKILPADRTGNFDVYSRAADGATKDRVEFAGLEPLVHGDFVAGLSTVSPDGNWIAYESNESGDRLEIFLRPFPNVSGRREKVSIDGGRYPLWGRKGSGELFYMDLSGGMMAAVVKLSPSLTLGGVTKLFDWEKPPRGVSGSPSSPTNTSSDTRTRRRAAAKTSAWLLGSPHKKKTGKVPHVPLVKRWGVRKVKDIRRRDVVNLLDDIAESSSGPALCSAATICGARLPA